MKTRTCVKCGHAFNPEHSGKKVINLNKEFRHWWFGMKQAPPLWYCGEHAPVFDSVRAYSDEQGVHIISSYRNEVHCNPAGDPLFFVSTDQFRREMDAQIVRTYAAWGQLGKIEEAVMDMSPKTGEGMRMKGELQDLLRTPNV